MQKNQPTTEDKGSTVERRHERSAAYPSTSLEKALDAITRVNGKLGQGPYDRESVAKALDFSGVSGASSSLIGTLVHFGLLERQGNSYRRSELAKRIMYPLDDVEKNTAIIEALRRPRLYEKLLDRFNGQGLPSMLPNILTREYTIVEGTAPKAAQFFRDSCEFTGILKNGVITLPDGNAQPALATTPQPKKAEHVSIQQSQSTYSQTNIPLTLGVHLAVPEKMMRAFALGEFAPEIKALCKKIADWEQNNEGMYELV